MKSLYLTILFVAIFGCSYAQWVTTGNNISNTNPGNVGIGTTSPSSKLDIFNTLSGAHTTNSSLFRTADLYNAGANGQFFQIIGAGNGTSATNISLISNWGYLSLGARADASATPTNFLNILANGNVGIGTTSPVSLFSVVGGAVNLGTNFGQYTLATVDNTSTSPFAAGANLLGLYAGDFMLRSYWGVSIDLNDGLQGDNGAATNTRIPQTASFTVNSRTSSTSFTPLFVVRNNGNVLIGKTSQTNTSYKLDVAGTVRANAVTVNTSGADFVFESTYKLFPLTDLKKYIDQNHHLPEIASAQEMQAHGLNVGENQTKLLQKVEELTLYLIDQNKQLADQQKIIQTLQDHINNLEKRIKK
jgi:hypothetical protein